MSTLHRIKFFAKSDESVYLFEEYSVLQRSIEVTWSKLPQDEKPKVETIDGKKYLIDKLGQKIAIIDTISSSQVVYKEWTHF